MAVSLARQERIDGRLARGDERRARIAAAVIEVIAEHGVRGVTHRRVAQAAGVPLGSTTYYFATLDDLLQAGLELAVDRNCGVLATIAPAVEAGQPLERALADLGARLISEGRARYVAEYELYLAAMRTPALRPIALKCDREMAAALRPYLPDERAARLVVFGFDGLLLNAMLAETPPAADDLLPEIARLVDALRASSATHAPLADASTSR